MNNPYHLNVGRRFSTHNVIVRQLGTVGKFLDVGCNDGYLGRHSHNVAQFYGIDYRASCVAAAAQDYCDTQQVDLNGNLALKWKFPFETIIFADVLEHVSHPSEVLKHYIDDSLTVGGRVIISLPNIANWRVRLGLLFGRFEYTDSGILDRTHLHFYTFQTATRFVENTGLQVVSTYYGSSVFGRLISLSGGLLRGLLASSIILEATKPPPQTR